MGEKGSQDCLPQLALTVVIYLYVIVTRPHPAAQVILAPGRRRLIVTIIVTAFFHNPGCASLLIASCVTLGKLVNLSDHQFPYLKEI